MRFPLKLVAEGEWVSPKRRGYKMACCDCGLVHSINFRLVKSGSGYKIQLQGFRDEKATESQRNGKQHTKP